MVQHMLRFFCEYLLTLKTAISSRNRVFFIFQQKSLILTLLHHTVAHLKLSYSTSFSFNISTRTEGEKTEKDREREREREEGSGNTIYL